MLDKKQNRLFWRQLAQYYKLTDDILDNYRDCHDWDTISLCQQLSLEQIEKYRGYINFKYLSSNKKINWTDEMIKAIESWGLRLDYKRIGLRTDKVGNVCYKKMLDDDTALIIKNYGLPKDFKFTKDTKYDWKKCEIVHNNKTYQSISGPFIRYE